MIKMDLYTFSYKIEISILASAHPLVLLIIFFLLLLEFVFILVQLYRIFRSIVVPNRV